MVVVGLVGGGLVCGFWSVGVWVCILVTLVVCCCWLLLVWIGFSLLGFMVTLVRVGWWLVVDWGWWLLVGGRVG